MLFLCSTQLFFILLSRSFAEYTWKADELSGREINKCGRNISGTKNYINMNVNVTLSSLANILLANQLPPHQFSDVLAGTSFQNLPADLHDVTVTDWVKINSTQFTRTVQYGRYLRNSPVDHVKLKESQIAIYNGNFFELEKIVPQSNFGIEINFKVFYCLLPSKDRSSSIEVDAELKVVDNLLAYFALDKIRASSHEGFTEAYGALTIIIKSLEEDNEMTPNILTMWNNEPMDEQDHMKKITTTSAASPKLTTCIVPRGIMEKTQTVVLGTCGVIIGVFVIIVCLYAICCRNKKKSFSSFELNSMEPPKPVMEVTSSLDTGVTVVLIHNEPNKTNGDVQEVIKKISEEQTIVEQQSL